MEWILTATIFGLIALNLAALKMKIPLVTILLGIISIAASAVMFSYDNTQVAFSPYPQLTLFFVTIAVLVTAGLALRD